MPTVAQTLQERLRDALAALELTPDDPVQVVPTADPRNGDYQASIAMVLAKARRENPRTLAGRIAEKINLAGISGPAEVAGPGFINFRLDPEFVAQRLHALSADSRLGVEKDPTSKTLIIEFSSPNIAKPMHVGHIRSSILGDAITRVARFLGHRVITDNHLGDWGTQFGKVIYAWKHFRDNNALETDPMAELVRLYREADLRSKQDFAVLEQCRLELVKLQQGDPENRAIWGQAVALSLREFASVYKLLGVEFDEQLGESAYDAELPSMVARLLAKGIAEISDGAAVIFDNEISETPFMIRKSDGGFGYASTDIATLEYRIKRWNPDGIWYVVGVPQQLHFRQLFSVARRLGYRVDLEHIAFGSILGEDRKLMRTRSGESVPLRELLEEAIQRAGELVREKNPALTDIESGEIARTVGLGAVKYAELSQHRLTDYAFSWSKMLSFQGNTAPYLQNAYVRSRAIFRRLDGPFQPPSRLVLADPAEQTLGKEILRFGEVLPAVLDGFKPNVLASFLYELAAKYHVFYERCPVLTAEGETRTSRLLLCDLFSRTIKTGLMLLGIEVPERM
jgi:arginyl-tRNA synthetase